MRLAQRSGQPAVRASRHVELVGALVQFTADIGELLFESAGGTVGRAGAPLPNHASDESPCGAAYFEAYDGCSSTG